jgi:hypothetical protein
MTEPTALPPPEKPAEPPAEAPARPTSTGRLLPMLSGLGFLVLLALLVWVWRHPVVQPQSTEQVDALAKQVGTLETRVARLEQRPQPTPTDLAPVLNRLTALEQHAPAAAPASTTAAAPPDLAPLAARIAALEQRQPANLGPLETRIAALEARQPADNQLAVRIDALAAAQQKAQADVSRRLDADDTRLAAIEKIAGQTSTQADRLRQVGRIQAAMLALQAGQKLGEIPGAPPALAKFATTDPPTEVSLRASFTPAARNALAAARPVTEGKPMLARLWAEAQDLVTVRQGDRVLVGDPTSGVLDRAREALAAGDLAGAVSAIGSLGGPAAQAMAGWLAEARALLQARAALTEWAAQG